jgi:hypothetical protein
MKNQGALWFFVTIGVPALFSRYKLEYKNNN